jgi:MFS transporter, CP family, cyanate transporter
MDAISPGSDAPNQADTLGRGQSQARTELLQHSGWSIAAVLLIAFNLRPAITPVALFLADIRRDLGLSGLEISVLTMAPVICLGAFGPGAPPLARRFGTETVLLASLLALAIGCVVRSFGAAPLFVGTVVIGASMCLLGVLTPVIVKRDFPNHVGLMMGLYTMLICLGPAVATATAVPMQHALGGSWESVLLFWGLPALIGAIVIVPQLCRKVQASGLAEAHVTSVLRDPLAWQVTGYFGFISSLGYDVFNWAPSMLEARGLDPTASGVVVSITYVAQMVTGLLAPVVAGRQRDQRLIIVIAMVLTAGGLLGFVFAPVWSLSLFSVALGLGQGAAFGVGLLLFVLRAGDPHAAAKLSALAQTIGYLLAGLIGPFAVGVIYDWAGSWPVVAVFYTAIGLASLIFGLGAGRARTLKVR